MQALARYGRVNEATIIPDRRTGRPKRCGFADMPMADAERAIAAMHGVELGGRDLTVRFASPAPQHH